MGEQRAGHTEAVHRSSGLSHFRIWDINQKTFYLRNNQLVAGYLQGSNTKLEGEWLPGKWVLCGYWVTLPGGLQLAPGNLRFKVLIPAGSLWLSWKLGEAWPYLRAVSRG